MNQKERLIYLIKILLKEKDYVVEIPEDEEALFSLYRSLVNVREAAPISQQFLEVQDEMLKEENRRKGIVSLPSEMGIFLWQGDITRLQVDAIVNAANAYMEGCFIPGHHCIDNAIHTYAGVQLRGECHRIMSQQGHIEPVGNVKLTPAYNLPSSYILHTVGPMIQGEVTQQDEELLASCYRSCMMLAAEHHLQSIAFCCISTGVFHFPAYKAAQIAIQTVKECQKITGMKQVIFNVFLDADREVYEELLGCKAIRRE